MKRFLSPIFFLCLTSLLCSQAEGQPTQFNNDCTPCHGGAGNYPTPTSAEGFRHGGWDLLFTTMRIYQPAIPAGDRAAIVNYLDSNFPIGSPLSLPTGTVGVAYSQTMTAIGGTAPYTWTVSGQPANLNISSGGVLSGTPNSSGTFTLTFTMHDNSGLPTTNPPGNSNLSQASFTRSLTINPPATLSMSTAPTLPTGTVGQLYAQQQFGATGGVPPYTWSASPALPSGLQINSSTGLVSGTPATGTQGSYSPTIQVKDSLNATDTRVRPFTINPAQLQITTAPTLPTGTVGQLYAQQQFAATGGIPPYTWSASPALPSGLQINSSTGLVSGTPAAGTQGSYSPTIQVKDSNPVNTTATVVRPFTVNAAQLQITTAPTLPTGTVGQLYSQQQFGATGGVPPYTWSATPALPSGLQINTSTGLVSGTPAVGTQGSYNPTIQVKDSLNVTATVVRPFTINPPPLVITLAPTLPAGAVLQPYAQQQFGASGGVPPYTWSAIPALPAGLQIDNTGLVSGTPAAGTQGAYSPTIQVKDSLNATTSVSRSFTIGNALPPPAISTLSPNTIIAAVGVQTLFINGSGFQNGPNLKVHVINGGFQTDLTGSQVTFLSSTQLSIRLDVGTLATTWTATVINQDTQSSNTISFNVVVAGTTSFALPQFTFGGGWYTALYFANTTNAAAQIQVNFIDNNGAPFLVQLLGIGSVTSQTVTVNPHSTALLEAPNSGSTQQEGWANVALPTGVTGYAVFRQSVAGRPDQEALVPLTPESSLTADLTYDDVNFTTSVAFLNPTGQSVTVNINAFDAAGNSAGSAQVVLTAHSKKATRLIDIAGLSGVSGKRGRAVFTVGSGAVSVLGLRFGASAFTSIPVSHRPAVAETRTISFALPQFVFGGAWYTALYFSNTTSATVNVPLTFVDDNGGMLSAPLVGIGNVSTRTVTLAPGATQILEALNSGTPGQGWVDAVVPPGVTGYAVFRQVVPNRTDQEAVVPLTSESNQTADLVYDDVNFTTSVAFLNPSDQQSAVAINAFSANGSPIGSTQFTLAPRSKTATVLRDLAGLTGMVGNRGWVSFSVGNGDVSVIGLRFGGVAFTTIPVLHR